MGLIIILRGQNKDKIISFSYEKNLNVGYLSDQYW